jgi:hypothetical protein
MSAPLSIAAQQAFLQARKILHMDDTPAHIRLEWQRKIGEANRLLYRRRRGWLMRAGVGAYLCNRDWDELRAEVRAKLCEVSA